MRVDVQDLDGKIQPFVRVDRVVFSNQESFGEAETIFKVGRPGATDERVLVLNVNGYTAALIDTSVD